MQVLAQSNMLVLYLQYVGADMQKVATTRPLVAEVFSDCGRILAEFLLNS
jgi:hypothetical protein